MKVLCTSCDRLAEPGSYRLDAGVLVIECSRCGAELRAEDTVSKGMQAALDRSAPPPSPPAPSTPKVVALRAVGPDPAVIAAEAATSEDPFAAPEGRCPKCIAKRRDGELSCRQCGLTFVNFVKHEVIPPAPLDKIWKELLANWSDLAAHDRLLAAAVTSSALPSVARLYQIRLAVSPDDQAARRGRDEVLRLATASATAFVSTAGGPQLRARSLKVGVLIVGIIMLAILSATLIRTIAAAP